MVAVRPTVTASKVSSFGPGLVALVTVSVVWWLGGKGVDQAAEIYRITQVHRYGLQLFDSGWFAGNLPLGYSLLFPALAAAVGPFVVVAASAALATWSFDRLVVAGAGRRPLGVWYFATATAVPVVIGQWPYLAGEACALSALVGLARGRRRPALALGVVTALFSPLAAGFLALAGLAWAIGSAGRRDPLSLAAAALLAVGLLAVSFPGDGAFPDAWTSMVATELFCLAALSPLVQVPRPVRAGAALYAVAALVAFAAANPVGGTISRLATTVGVPLLLCVARPARPLAPHRAVFMRIPFGRLSVPAVVVVLLVGWQWSPVTTWTTSTYSTEGYYRPLVSELRQLATTPIRIEVVPTRDHWEAAFVAPDFPIARGWERQLDTGYNPLFYAPRLTASAYQGWLQSEGVSYVALPAAPLDYASQAEASLLRSSDLPGLRLVWSTPDWRLWAVDAGPGLVSGPASLVSVRPGHVTLVATALGMITLRVRYTRFWSVTSGAACVAADPPYQWTSMRALGPGRIDLTATLLRPPSPAGCP